MIKSSFGGSYFFSEDSFQCVREFRLIIIVYNNFIRKRNDFECRGQKIYKKKTLSRLVHVCIILSFQENYKIDKHNNKNIFFEIN